MMTEVPTREEAEAKKERFNALEPGDRVRVTFDAEKGCACGCTRSDSYTGTIVADDKPRRRGTIRVMDYNGNCLSEFAFHVDTLDAGAGV